VFAESRCAQDHSGAIDARELKGFFASLGVSLSDKEVVNAMKDIDDSGDNNVAFAEMLDWLTAKGVWDPAKVGFP
jgi:Ca2+-binding EF-hand superfamily protein